METTYISMQRFFVRDHKRQSHTHISDGQLAQVAKILGMLAETPRVRLLRELLHGSIAVSELMDLTKMRQGKASKQQQG